MAGFREPSLFSANTMMATIIRLSKTFGLTSTVMRKLLVRGSTDEASAKVFAGYEPTEHDVFVATYSKSGTNWAMQIAQQIAHHGEAEFDHIYDVVAWPEAHFSGIVPLKDPRPLQASPTGKRVIKTALRAPHVPYDENATYLSVMRDPKDVFVSSYHFVFGVFGLYDAITMEEWLDMYLTNQYPVGPWPDHAASFWAIRDRPNVLIMPFAEMKDDLPKWVRKAAETMRVELTEEQLAKVVEKASFSYMKAREEQFGPPRMAFVDKPGTMIRTGKKGGSSELLTREQQARIDAYCIARLKELGSDMPYEDLFEVVRE